jgi:hypothetical protein
VCAATVQLVRSHKPNPETPTLIQAHLRPPTSVMPLHYCLYSGGLRI